jgi:hypothetical protein
MKKILQAAACHKVSVAHPLSVFDKSLGTRKEGNVKKKRDKLDAQQASFQRRQVLKAEEGGGMHARETELSHQQSTFAACFGMGGWLRARKASTQAPLL